MEKTMKIWFGAPRGGLGASFAAANIALALARRGRRVLLVDASPACRVQDSIFGCAESVVYDLADLCAGRAGAGDVVLPLAAYPGLSLIPGAFDPSELPYGIGIARALEPLMADYDVMICDAPFVPTRRNGAPAYDLICCVSDPRPISLAAAQQAGAALFAAGAQDVRLLLNRFSLLPPKKGGQASALSMVDAAGLRLLGILPPVGEREDGRETEEYPLLVPGRRYRREPALFAADAIAARLGGDEVPLLSTVRGVRRTRAKLLY